MAKSAFFGVVCGSAALGLAAAASAEQTFNREQLVEQTLRWTHSNRAAIVAVGPELVAVLLRRPELERSTGVLRGSLLQAEVSDESVAKAYGWRSMRVQFDVSCAILSDHVVSMDVFPEHNGGGVSHSLPLPEGWVRPSTNTYASAAIDLLCTHPQQLQNAPTIQAARVLATARQIPEVRPAAATGPSSSANKVVPRPGTTVVQVAALGSQAAAVDAVERLQSTYASALSGLSTRIEQAEVHGKTYYRVIVVGFSEPRDASAFCGAVHGLSPGCIIHTH